MASRWATTRSARRAASVPTIPSRVEPRLVSQGKPRKLSAINLRCAVVVIELPTDNDTGHVRLSLSVLPDQARGRLVVAPAAVDGSLDGHGLPRRNQTPESPTIRSHGPASHRRVRALLPASGLDA